MKTKLIYGLLLAAAGFLFTLVLFIFGLESDPAKIGLSDAIRGIGMLVVASVIIALGIRAARAKWPAAESFTYGGAFAVGAGITAVASLLAIATHTFYVCAVNPQYTEFLIQSRLNILEAHDISGDQFDRAEKMTRIVCGVTGQAVSACIRVAVSGLIISLIAAAFLRRPAAPPKLA